MSDDGHPEGPSRRAVLAAGAVLAANALLGCEDTVPVEPTRDSLVDGEAMTEKAVKYVNQGAFDWV